MSNPPNMYVFLSILNGAWFGHSLPALLTNVPETGTNTAPADVGESLENVSVGVNALEGWRVLNFAHVLEDYDAIFGSRPATRALILAQREVAAIAPRQRSHHV